MRTQTIALTVGLIAIYCGACFGQQGGARPISALPDEWHCRLSGVWGGKTTPLTQERTLSFGKVRYKPNSTMIIDLRAKEPFLEAGGGVGLFRVASYEVYDATRIRLNLEVIASAARSGYVVIQLHEDGAMQIESHLEPDTMPKSIRDYQLYGPCMAGNERSGVR